MKFKQILTILTVIAIGTLWVLPVWAGDTGKIDLNSASVEELMDLKGIGPKLAVRIIEYRENNGPFKTTRDIIKVKGIGPKTWEMNKDRIAAE
ncbi:MAG: helix-hairpin-helix domain-containing protein [Desulfobacterales bacterium]|jgi:competence protein ComEA